MRLETTAPVFELETDGFSRAGVWWEIPLPGQCVCVCLIIAGTLDDTRTPLTIMWGQVWMNEVVPCVFRL